jgi:hypothetical protein
MFVQSFIHHIHYDMFRPVIAAIIGEFYSYIKGRTEVEASRLQLKYKFIIVVIIPELSHCRWKGR